MASEEPSDSVQEQPGPLSGACDGGQGCTRLLHRDLLYFLPHLLDVN